jgi:hypothetical protein
VTSPLVVSAVVSRAGSRAPAGTVVPDVCAQP